MDKSEAAVEQAHSSSAGAVPTASAQRRELARRLDCLLDEEVQELAMVTDGTLEAWRKRGIGPPYVRFGNAYLYPRSGAAAFLAARQAARERLLNPRLSVL